MLARALAAAVVLGAILVGCKGELNVNYCAAHPDDPDCRDNGLIRIDAPDPLCRTDMECTDGLKGDDPGRTICDTSTDSCVQCLDVVAEKPCMDIGQFCGPDRACHGCIVDNHCAATSGVCLATQQCAPQSAVVFVSPSGTGNCDKDNPCSLQMGVSMLSATRYILKLQPSPTKYSGAPITIRVPGNLEVQVLGTGATFQPSTPGDALTIAETRVVIVGLTVEGATNGDGIACGMTSNLSLRDVRVTGSTGMWPDSGWGLHSNGCTLLVERSRFSANVGGGMKVSSGDMDIRNNIIDRNGSGDVARGNVEITNASGAFRFNTVVLNQSRSGSRIGGLTCTQAAAGTFKFARNIIAANLAANDEIDAGDCEGDAVINYVSRTLDEVRFADTNEFALTAQSIDAEVLDDPLSDADCLVVGSTDHIDDHIGAPRPVDYCDRGAREYKP